METNIIIYSGIMLALLVWLIKDTRSYQDNGYLPNKQVGEIGGKGFLMMIFIIIRDLFFWHGI